MALILEEISRTFREFLLVPGLTSKSHIISNVSLQVPLSRYKKGGEPGLQINIPLVSSAMQAVSGPELAIALARKGGCAFIFCSQSVEAQAAMVKKVKDHKAGFVESDSNLAPEATLQDAVNLRRKTGHSTIAVTEGGARHGKLLGLLTSKDFWEFKDDLNHKVSQHFTPVDRLVMAEEGVTLQDATELLWKNKKECLPVVDKNGCLKALVFRRDYFDHKSNPSELTDSKKRLFVGAAINTHDYKTRVPALVEAGADILCIDSSDGFSEWQGEVIDWVRGQYGDQVKIGAGNIVTAEGFDYLARVKRADFVKVGIGGGSICITREQKGIGRGQASAVIDVAAARDRYFQETGEYVPVCSDGGLNHDTDLIMAMALGSDFVMMGKYFAMTDESPTEKSLFKGRYYKPYWGEGSQRARNWERYKQGESKELLFEEGVDAYVPCTGPLAGKVETTVTKIKATMCNVGALDVPEFHSKAVLTRVSEMTLVEGGTSSVEQLDRIQREQ